MKSVIIRILLIIALAMALWAVLKWEKIVNQTNNQQQNIDTRTDDVNNPNTSSSYLPDAIIAKHFYENGTHRVEGTVYLPNPCWGMEFETLVAESFPEQVTLNFILTPPPAEQICAQVVDEREFISEFQASPNPVLSARVNGQSIPLVTQDMSGTLAPIE